MPPRSAAPATPRSGAGSPQTRAAVVDRGPTPKMQTGTRTSGLEPGRDRSPRWRVHGCAECLPRLRWRPSPPDHVFGDRRRGDLEPELEQFTMDARGAPQWVLLAHPLDEFAQLTANSGPSWPSARFPAPIRPKPGPMPAQEQ